VERNVFGDPEQCWKTDVDCISSYTRGVTDDNPQGYNVVVHTRVLVNSKITKIPNGGTPK